MRDGLARAIPSYAEAGILDRLWTDQRQHQQMECLGSGDLPDAQEADHHRPARTRPEWPGNGEILDRP
jgi:hypothetical protein